MNSRWSGIIMGAVVGTAIETMLVLFGMGVGFIVLPIESSGGNWRWIGFGIASGIYMVASVAVSYGIGSFIASRLHLPQEKGEVCFQGLATWGVISIVTGILGLLFFSTTIKSTEMGLGGMAALESIKRANPRIVTDFSMFKGKAVTSIDLGVSPEKLVKVAETKASTTGAKEITSTVRKATAGACLALCLGMLVGMVSATVGAWWGRPTRLSAKPLGRTKEAA